MASSFEFKRKSLENAIESLLCYKCKAVPGAAEKQKNRYVCLDYSHQLCEECKSECDCGSVVGKRPNPVVHQMLKDLPIYCPHYKTGCRQIFMEDKGLKDWEDHQMECVFRQVNCPYTLCQDTNDGNTVFKDIAEHFTSKHDSNACMNLEGKLVKSNLSHDFLLSTSNGKGTNIAYWLRKMSLHNIDFFLAGRNENDILYFWIYILGSRFEAKKYAYTLSVTGKNESKFTFYGHVKPLDEAAKDIIAEKSVFMIGFEFVKTLRDENLNWPMEVTIHALKEEVKDKDEESGVEDDSD